MPRHKPITAEGVCVHPKHMAEVICVCARSQQIMLPVHCLPEASCHVLLVVILGGDVQFRTVCLCVS